MTAVEIQNQSQSFQSDDQIKQLQDASELRFWSRGPSETVKLYVPNIVVNVLHTKEYYKSLSRSKEYITDTVVRRCFLVTTADLSYIRATDDNIKNNYLT